MKAIKETLGKIALWVLGLLHLVLGAATLFTTPLTAIPLVLLGAIFLPPVRHFIGKHVVHVETKYYQMLGAGLFVAFTYASMHEATAMQEAEEKAQAERMKELAAQGRQRNLDKFANEKDSLLLHYEMLYVKERYQEILDESQRYVITDDSDLLKIREDAKAKLAQIASQNRTAELLDKIRGLKETDFLALKEAYVELAQLNPLNAEYVEKRTHFSAKVKEIQDKQDQWVRLYGEPPKPYTYKGAYYEVTSYLEGIAHDPDSIEMDSCTQVYMGVKGWVVGCDYRGRNALGGMIRQSSWFRLISGHVVSMSDDLKSL